MIWRLAILLFLCVGCNNEGKENLSSSVKAPSSLTSCIDESFGRSGWLFALNPEEPAQSLFSKLGATQHITLQQMDVHLDSLSALCKDMLFTHVHLQITNHQLSSLNMTVQFVSAEHHAYFDQLLTARLDTMAIRQSSGSAYKVWSRRFGAGEWRLEQRDISIITGQPTFEIVFKRSESY